MYSTCTVCIVVEYLGRDVFTMDLLSLSILYLNVLFSTVAEKLRSFPQFLHLPTQWTETELALQTLQGVWVCKGMGACTCVRVLVCVYM